MYGYLCPLRPLVNFVVSLSKKVDIAHVLGYNINEVILNETTSEEEGFKKD
jgi:hypothetical protein